MGGEGDQDGRRNPRNGRRLILPGHQDDSTDRIEPLAVVAARIVAPLDGSPVHERRAITGETAEERATIGGLTVDEEVDCRCVRVPRSGSLELALKLLPPLGKVFQSAREPARVRAGLHRAPFRAGPT